MFSITAKVLFIRFFFVMMAVCEFFISWVLFEVKVLVWRFWGSGSQHYDGKVSKTFTQVSWRAFIELLRTCWIRSFLKALKCFFSKTWDHQFSSNSQSSHESSIVFQNYKALLNFFFIQIIQKAFFKFENHCFRVFKNFLFTKSRREPAKFTLLYPHYKPFFCSCFELVSNLQIKGF